MAVCSFYVEWNCGRGSKGATVFFPEDKRLMLRGEQERQEDREPSMLGRNKRREIKAVFLTFAALDSEQRVAERCERLHPSHSSLALVSFVEIRCPRGLLFISSQAAGTVRPGRREKERKK